jgi:hypothetical protein
MTLRAHCQQPKLDWLELQRLTSVRSAPTGPLRPGADHKSSHPEPAVMCSVARPTPGIARGK